MIRRQDDRRVVPAIGGVEMVENAPELRIAKPHQRGVVGTQLGDLLRRFLDLSVTRPVEGRTVIARGSVAIVRWRMERLVRVECLHLEKPVVPASVLFQKGKR